ncbi:MAG: hypothetical protein CHKLHMKO_00273 [Candidatus Argoarchaeum ethanivorans]|uniref:Uncharacterized protein n=1 Tax=Candidatus Argoarchaeum ethanivorans TaxID=2608793 RepID=A0A811T9E4_9EURY|nr:MAG: hypothetical protein CHKLHMKO_00273 [Candidatus Argoarchaeum ethanivorans]
MDVFSTEEELFKYIRDDVIYKYIKHDIEKRLENKEFWDYDWDKNKRIGSCPKHEIDISPTIQKLLRPYLKPKGISIVKESDEGIGDLDFKCIYNNNSEIMKVHIEYKNAHHEKLRKGLTTQLPAYMDADEAKYGIYLVFWFKDGINFDKPQNIESIDILQEELDSEAEKIEDKIIEPIVIDVTKKKSASKR